MQIRLLSFFYVFIFLCFTNQAQEIDIKSGFQEDSITVGGIFHFWMVATYPKGQQILLPDSTFDFSPYFFHRTYFFDSKLKNGKVYDSVVYELQSFEIDSIQYYSLPAIVFHNAEDTTTFMTDNDSVFFKHLVPVLSDTLKLKKNVDYQAVKIDFNQLYFLIILLIIIAILVTTYFIFGKKIIQIYKIRKLKKDYILFSQSFMDLIHKLKKEGSPSLVEEALILWKNYIEKLENIAIKTMTSKEIIQLSFGYKLGEPLKSIDRCIYGDITNNLIFKQFQFLEDFTQDRYLLKLDELNKLNIKQK